MYKRPLVLFVMPYTNVKKKLKYLSDICDFKIINNLHSMEEMIYENSNVDLIVMDKCMLANSADESLIRWIATRKLIKIIMLVNSNEDAMKAISLHAKDFILKPIIPELLKYRISELLKYDTEMRVNTKINLKIQDELNEKSSELSKLQAGIIGVLSEIIEFRDFDINSHDIRSQYYVELMIKKMIDIPNPYQREISLWDINDHILSAQLHDIGKIIIPNEILTKPCSLTNAEYEVIKTHVIIGANIIDKIIERVGKNSYLSIAKKYIESHHEHWDGNGYPYKLSGTDIPLEGRILAIVDAYDVITTQRSYKEPFTHEDAVKRINDSNGKQFDPELIKIFNLASNDFKRLKNTFK